MAFNALLSILLLIGIGGQLGHCVDSIMRQEHSLNLENTFIVGWEVKGPESKIIFDVVVKTTGFVGFGLAQKASMEGGDLIIGGVYSNGTGYFQDYHSKANTPPMVDAHQDWVLESAAENGSYTYLKFSRLLDTCDPDDIPITIDTVNLIWSYGATDDITMHTNRGARVFNLLDPVGPPFDSSSLTVWEVRVRDPLPAAETSYLCTVHKLRKFTTKHHMVALEAYLDDEDSVRHTHHFTVTACNQDDPEVLATLKALEGLPGQTCYSGTYGKLKPKCNSILFGWAVGGKRVVLPENLGVPVGEENDQDHDVFVMLEVHYDNPTLKNDLMFTSGFNLYFTDKPRENEGSVLVVGADIIPSLLIPPHADKYVVSGHCSSEYTKEFFPSDGINIVSVQMQSHLAGRKLKVRHFRGDVELPPLLSNDNYDFDYQQTRQLPYEVKVLPGDHLTMECEMQTLDRNYVTFAGESTHNELCHAFLVYYPRIDLLACRSGVPLEELYGKFGIEEIDQNPYPGFPLDPTVLKPENLEGQHVQKVINDFNWTPEYIKTFEQEMRYGQHAAYYTMSAVSSNTFAKKLNYTGYPAATEYMAPDQCTSTIPSSTQTTEKTTTTTTEVGPTTPEVPSLVGPIVVIKNCFNCIFYKSNYRK